MFNKLLITASLLLSIALASCEDKDSDNQDDPGDTPTAETDYIHGQVTINGSPVENGTYTVSDYFSNATPDNGSFDMETVVFEGLPQIMMVTNNEGNIVMLNKSFDTNKTINEESTALALATLNPLFGHLKDDEYDQIMDIIKATPSYQPYYDEVCKSIAEGKDIFDTASTSLADKLGNVLNELFSTNTSTQTPSRAIGDFLSDDDTYPIVVTAEASTVRLRVRGLNPTYELFVSHNNLAYGEPALVKSRSSYAVSDLLKSGIEGWINGWDYVVDSFNNGEYTDVVLEEDGKYFFRLDRTTDAAISDLSRQMLNDALGAFSFVAEGIYENQGNLMNEFKDQFQLALQGEISPLEFSRIITSKILDDYVEHVLDNEKGVVELFGKSYDKQNIIKLAGKVNAIFDSLTGLAQEAFRAFYGFNAPDKVNFQLCKQSWTIQECEQHDIIILKGNNQIAAPGTTLPINLCVGIKAEMGSMVKFEVTSGGGSLEKDVVKVSDNDTYEEYNVAETTWTLGKEGAQTVKAYIINPDGSFDPLGPSVKFVASFSGDYLLSVGDIVTFEYDSEGRPKEVSMIFDDYSSTSSFSYDPMVITNILEDVELYKSTWQDFKFSDDGKRITSFKWVEDGDFGNVTIKYGPDNRIISIKDNTTDCSTVTTFDWDEHGRLLKANIVEIDDERPEDLTLTYLYGDEEVECSSLMYPLIMCMDEPWFFMTGLFGEGPAYLPTKYSYQDKYFPDDNFHINLKYVTSDNGKISSEECFGVGGNMVLNYRYGSIGANSRSVGSDLASFPGFNKEKRKIRRIGHSRR